MEKQLNMIAHMDPKSPLVEAYRMLRTNLQFSHIDRELKTLAITSATTNEGKSTVVTNLAIVLAQAGNEVLVIDCDFRNPTQHKHFERSNRVGFSNCIANHEDVRQVIQQTDIDGVHVIAVGAIPPNPSELLGARSVQGILDLLKREYDYILIDTPPILPVTDAAVIGAKVDGVILLIEYDTIPPSLLKEAKARLTNPNINLLGAVLSKVDINSGNRYEYYHYYKTAEHKK